MKYVVLSILALTLILGVLSDHNKENNYGNGKHHGNHHGGYNHQGGATPPKLESNGLTHPVDENEPNSTVDPHPEGHHAHCIWINEAGVKYDLNRVLPNKQIDLAFVFYGNESYNLFIRPCGPVVTSACPPNASVCLVKDDKDGVSFGTYLNKQFAQGVDNNSVEVSYGNGELCGNGVPRKSIVTYTCSNETTRIISVKSDDDECFLEINIGLSEHDCPTNPSPIGCHGNAEKGHAHRSNVFTVVMFSSMALLMSFFLCFALCACRRSRRLRAARLQAHHKASKKIPSIPYEAVPVQLVPGGFAPVDPYTMQGYPMISLVPPTQLPKGETV